MSTEQISAKDTAPAAGLIYVRGQVANPARGVSPVDVACEQAQQREVASSDEVWQVDVAEGIGAPLLAALISAMALVLAVLTPVTGVKAACVLIVVVSAIVAFRLVRRGGGTR